MFAPNVVSSTGSSRRPKFSLLCVNSIVGYVGDGSLYIVIFDNNSTSSISQTLRGRIYEPDDDTHTVVVLVQLGTE